MTYETYSVASLKTALSTARRNYRVTNLESYKELVERIEQEFKRRGLEPPKARG